MNSDILLGAKRLPCRLIVLPVPPEQVGKRRKQQKVSARSLALVRWTLYAINIPADRLSVEEVPILGSTRWQIECLFDLPGSPDVLRDVPSRRTGW